MSRLSIDLFGTFQARLDGRPLTGLQSSKGQELIAYLLIHRDKPHSRESLSTLLWGDNCTTSKARSYLRKTVWQVGQVLGALPESSAPFLSIGTQHLQANSGDWLQLDVAEFEHIFDAAKDVPGRTFDTERATLVSKAITLYRGDLLEGQYADWCTYRRERYKHMYLMLLDKLMSYHESKEQYDSAIACGDTLLVHDAARERTHRHMMRLYYQNGDRTSAIRQYKTCCSLLRSELDIGPGPKTVALYGMVKEGLPIDIGSSSPDTERQNAPPPEDVTPADDCLRQVREDLTRIRTRIDSYLSAP